MIDIAERLEDGLLRSALRGICPADEEAAARCRERWNRIAKPLYGLGVLEDLVVRIAAAQGTDQVDISRKGLVVFCADNGVVDEGVSQTDTPRVEKRKCRRGTANMTKGPAMMRREAIFAIEAGISKALELEKAGYRILAAGEMGIGNTTTSAAVTAVLLGMDPAEVTGRGAGLSDEGLRKKTDAIRRAIDINRPDPEDPLGVLSKVGGFDIAALTGLFLGGASLRVPVVIDGVISAVAALIAARLEPSCRDYMLPSHISGEPASMAVMTALGFIPEKQETKQGKADREKDSMKKVPGPAVSPILHAGMHLGEGTGAVALFPLLDMAVDIYYKMDTFEGIAVEQYRDYDAE